MKRLALRYAFLAAALLISAAIVTIADTTPQTLPFSQNWTNTGLITVSDDWSGVPGVVGYRGDGLTAATAVDPQTVLGEGTAVVDVNANQTNPATFTTGGVSEFEITDPVVAFQGSGTARAPSLVFSVNTTGFPSVTVSYNLRDVDGSADNSVQPVALQFRVGSTGNFTNVPAGFVADASTGPSLATLVTPVSAVLPAAAGEQPLVQVRVITTDAVGSDEWIGVDDFQVSNATTNPSGVGASNPSSVLPGGSTLLTVTVTSGANPTSTGITVNGDLTSIGGSATQQFFDDGATSGDVAAGDNVFSFQATVSAGTTPGAKSLPFSISDAQARSGSGSIPLTVTSPVIGSPDIVISQVYGGGGNAGATLRNDFIEIFNRGTASVNITGWSVQYASATGSSWAATALSGTLQPGQYYLVQEAQGTGGTTSLPTPDATGTIAMSATAGKVALVMNTTLLACGGTAGNCFPNASVRDFVGFGTTANNFEGSGPTPAPSNTTAALRALDGCTDTDNNAADFATGAPNPRNTSSLFNSCHGDNSPGIASRSPVNGATGVAVTSNVTVTFSEPVDVTGSWYSISCGTSGSHSAAVTGGPTVFTIDPDDNFANGESCTVTIFGAQVSDQDTADPPDNLLGNPSWSFTTVELAGCDQPATHQIAQVQGSGDISPVAGQTVRVEGVVTGDFQGTTGLSGFYIQDDTPDSDPITSEGLFVFSNLDVAAGDRVLVTGRAIEFNGLTELSPVTAVDVCGTGSIAPLAYDLPRAEGTTFEPVENMLITFPETLAATEHFQLGRFGEVTVSSEGRLFQPTDRVDPGPLAAALQESNNRRRILIDDGSNVQNPATVPFLTPDVLRLGDTAAGITGVLSFGFGAYRLEPTAPITFGRTNPRPSSPPPVGGDIRVASFNTLNYFTTIDNGSNDARGADSETEFNRQQAKEVAAITGLDADVIGLMEIENNGATAVGSLVDALNAAVGPGTYSYITEPSLNPPNSFGGTFGTDAIKVALIYRPAAVTPVGAAQSSADAIFDRPPLIQTFQLAAGSEHFTIAVNHFKSKNCGAGDPGDADQGDGQGCFNARRVQQATALLGVLDDLGVPNPLIIGDLNAYTEEDPIHTLEAGGYADLSELSVSEAARYSYVFDGQSGELDHALVGPDLSDNVTGATIWHINADEPLILDYNTEFNPPGLYAPDAYRSSDHDPVVVGLDLVESPTQLIVVKHVIRDNGGEATAGDFTMSVTATNPSDDSFSGDEAGTTITLDPGSYEVTESGPSGYSAIFSADCSGTIGLGESKTCTFTNDDISPTLTVTKTVVNAAGGDTGRFDLRIDGAIAGTGGNVGDGGTTGGVARTAGSHSVGETAVAGTDLSDYVVTIGGDCGADGSITLALEQNATCTITNTRKSRVTVAKTENGAAPSNQWSFRLSGGPGNVSITKTTTVNDVPLNSGNLDFGVVPPGAGYTLCELAVPPAATSTFASQPGATVDPTTRDICITLSLGSGENRAFAVDNSYAQVSQITAAATCQQFSAGTAPDLPTLGSGGQVEYSVKNNKVSQANPGVFFYWVKLVVGPGGRSVVVDQSLLSGNFTRTFSIPSGLQPVYNSSCASLRASTATQAANGDVTVNWTAATAGTFYIGLKYNSSSIVGGARPDPGTNVDYAFATTGVLGSTDGLRLSKKK